MRYSVDLSLKDDRFDHYRNFMLYWYIDLKDAVCNACQCNCRVTNVIPFFGPYIGAIPSAVLIALADPMKGIYFLIFILLLQQFDGNILGPKILGNSTGLSAFWVIVSILLGGGLFGILGMLFGVPTFAVVYYIIKLLLDNQLEKKKLPTDSDCYNGDSYVDNDGTYFQKKR